MTLQISFMGRQPVLDRNLNIMGYELLFRSADVAAANITNVSLASAQVIASALSGFGFQELLGRHKGFINVNDEMLMGDSLELLPKEQVVLEILETVTITGEVIERCRDLKRKGFSLALDDHVYAPEYDRLYPYVDIIKIDLLQHEPGALSAAIDPFKQMPITLLAEKVETFEQHKECNVLGFDLFQGYFFAKPVVLKKKRIDIAGLALLRLLQQLLDGADVREIEETFRQHPNLTYNLLKLVNSVSMGLAEKIKSLRHAIMMLGHRQLIRWTQLAMFARGGSAAGSGTLLELSAMRGRLMELVAQRNPRQVHDAEYGDRAFMAGVLSLIDVVFDVPMEQVLSHLNLAEDVRSALLCREGELGLLLRIAELSERADFDAMLPLLAEIGLDYKKLLTLQLEAISWTHGLEVQA